MEYPASDWPCLNSEDFELAVPRNPEVLGVEVMAQAHVNVRVIDHFRVALGGSEILNVRFSTRDVFLVTDTAAIQLRYEVWPRDIVIHRSCAGIDGRMELVLQIFPATAGILSGKPAFRG